jgi:RimJ/RimL family protein N-acetyltransferase
VKIPHELETPRLRLRLFKQDDLDAYAAMMADPEVVRFLGDGKPLDRALTWRSMAAFTGHWTLRGYGMWVMEEKATGAFIGRAGLHYPEGWPMLEVGWGIVRSAWGKGYATEVGRLALEQAFANGATKVCSLIMPENLRSIRVAERLGETFERHIDVVGFHCALYSVSAPAAQR